MELQVTEVEERLDQVTSELTRAQQERERLAEQLQEEKRHSKVSGVGVPAISSFLLHMAWQLGPGISQIDVSIAGKTTACGYIIL